MVDSQPVFRVEDEGPVRRIVIDRPSRKNAIPAEGWSKLAEVLSDFDSSSSRVLVITGANGDFCSGADLAADDTFRGEQTVAETFAWMAPVGEAATRLFRLSKPTIAAVDGVAVGAGMNLALGCDIVIATERARFSEVFVRRGLTIDFGGTWLLPRIVGLARAREIALTGRIVDAAEALEIGLVAKVVAPGELEGAVMGTALSLAEGAPLAQRFIKTGLSRSPELSFEEAIQYESQAQAVLLASGDFREGVAAFLEKRDPRFRGS